MVDPIYPISLQKLILYAEDDPDDAFFFEKATRKAGLPWTTEIVDDGQAAFDWMAGLGEFSDRRKYPLPIVLVLDLKMPRKNGLEILEWVRLQEDFADLPVVILSTSGEPSDVERAMALGATRYFVKTVSSDEVVQYLAATCAEPGWQSQV